MTEKQLKEAATILARRNGMKVKASKPKDYYKKIGKKGLETRWGKKK